MKYYEVNFNIEAPAELMQDARDIVAAFAGEAGFETFEDTPEGVKGYVQQAVYDELVLKTLLGGFPLPSCKISFTTAEAEDKDWNDSFLLPRKKAVRRPLEVLQAKGFQQVVDGIYAKTLDGIF